jgi:hypothetical protein
MQLAGLSNSGKHRGGYMAPPPATKAKSLDDDIAFTRGLSDSTVASTSVSEGDFTSSDDFKRAQWTLRRRKTWCGGEQMSVKTSPSWIGDSEEVQEEPVSKQGQKAQEEEDDFNHSAGMSPDAAALLLPGLQRMRSDAPFDGPERRRISKEIATLRKVLNHDEPKKGPSHDSFMMERSHRDKAADDDAFVPAIRQGRDNEEEQSEVLRGTTAEFTRRSTE